MPDAIILGAGIAGLSAGIALRDAGYAVSIHDRAPVLEPIGAALSLWPNAVESLRRLGALRRIAAAAAPIRTMLLATQAGVPLIGPYRVDDSPDPGARGYLPTRALLQAALLDALGPDVPVRLGEGAAGIVQDARGVTVTFDDAHRETAALVVVADGIRSPTATALLGNPPAYCGYGGVLALSDPVGDDAQRGTVAEYWGRRERFGVCDCGGGRRYWFYMRDAPAGTPPPTHEAVVARLPGWPAGVAAAVAATAEVRLIPFAVQARRAPRRLGHGRVICVGDAAHAMEPNLGQGACQALEDAVVLGGIAATADPSAILPRFEAARLVRIRRIVRRSAEGRLGAHGAAPVRLLVRASLRALPAAIHERLIAGMHGPPA